MLKRILLLLTMLVVTTTASAFSLTDSKGVVHTLDSYKGKWVLVNFWATWCPPCLEEIPALNALHDKYKNTKLEVIGIAMEYQSPKQVLDFADSMFISYPIVLGSSKIAAQFGPVQGLPTTYLFNPAGKLVAYQVGGITQQAVENYINSKNATQK
ncbi:MAG: TlpA disulfide reductase family protein [Pseudomonadota bacterium]